MRYKSDFGLMFFVSVLIIFFSKVWSIFGDYPEAFKYGAILYRIIDVILFVLSNISIGVAATIVFYYIQQLIEKKKQFELYTELRRIVFFMFYRHLVVLSELEHFKELKQRERRGEGILAYDIFDIPILTRLYREINTEEQKEKFKNSLFNHFIKMSDQQIEEFSNSFSKNINEIMEKEDIRYFKGSNELIRDIYINYSDDFSIITSIYIRDRKKESNLTELTEEVVKDYVTFLEATLELYQELSIFMESIDRKKIKVFIKMLD